jgi:hypothetical protein
MKEGNMNRSVANATLFLVGAFALLWMINSGNQRATTGGTNEKRTVTSETYRQTAEEAPPFSQTKLSDAAFCKRAIKPDRSGWSEASHEEEAKRRGLTFRACDEMNISSAEAVLSPNPAIDEAREAFIRKYSNFFGPGKVDLTNKETLGAAIAAAMIATPPLCKDSKHNEAPPADKIVFFENFWGHVNNAQMQEIIKQKMVSQVSTMADNPGTREFTCTYGGMIHDMIDTFSTAAERVVKEQRIK